MKRCDFLLLPSVIATVWSHASAEVKIPRTGFIQTGSRQDSQSLLDAFRDGLSALGWTEGNNIIVLDRWDEDRTAQLPAIIKPRCGSMRASLSRSRSTTACGAHRQRSAWEI